MLSDFNFELPLSTVLENVPFLWIVCSPSFASWLAPVTCYFLT
ncbi:hypothetical protein EG68_12273, partial [Paragonimus skrjabini miyazakii]